MSQSLTSSLNSTSIGDTSSLAIAAANQAATFKRSKYTNITHTYIIISIAIETGGICYQQASEFIQELGKRISVITKEPKKTQ